MPSKVWDEITYTFTNFCGHTVEIWERIRDFIPILYNEFNYLSELYLKLIYVSERAPCDIWSIILSNEIILTRERIKLNGVQSLCDSTRKSSSSAGVWS